MNARINSVESLLVEDYPRDVEFTLRGSAMAEADRHPLLINQQPGYRWP